MIGRERVIASLNFKNPDRIPRDLWALPYICLFKKTDTFKRWQAKMDTLLEKAQDFSESGKVIRLEKIYDLEEQLSQ